MEEPQAVFQIALNANGSVSISGPINNKILCYGLLEAGRAALDDYVPQEQPGIVLLPQPHVRFNGD